MRSRSESVKRTVVDLSFSFFIALILSTDGKTVVAKEQGKAAERWLADISEGSLREIFE